MDWEGGANAVSAHTSIRTRTFPNLGVLESKPQNRLWNVAITVSAGADRIRLFQLLTNPEYIETWLRLPGASSNPLVATALPPNGYRLDQYGPGGPEICISGRYQVLRRSKLIFTWTREVWPAAQSSVVWVRLHGDFSRTTVRLDHFALPSEDEYFWHQRLWAASLKRLCSLFESCSDLLS